MSQAPTVVEIYNVTPTAAERVRLEMVVPFASLPDFAVDLPYWVAERIAMALLSTAAVVRQREGLPTQAESAHNAR